MLRNKPVLIGLIAVMLALCFTYSAYANVMDTSLALRDKLPADTLANLPDFISRMEAMGSKVSVDASTGYYIAYNEADLKAIFGEDALLIPSPPGLLTITYKRGGTYRYWGMLHGLVVADSASKVITITKGGFISNTNLNVNIAGDEVQINARDLTRSVFKISRDGVYSQNEYFVGCEPEMEATSEGCKTWLCEQESVGEGCEPGGTAYVDTSECNTNKMEEYKEFMGIKSCEIMAIVEPRDAYINVTGEAVVLSNKFLGAYRTEGYNKAKDRMGLNPDPIEVRLLFPPDEEQNPEDNEFFIAGMSEVRISPGEDFIMRAKSPVIRQFTWVGKTKPILETIEGIKIRAPRDGYILSLTGDDTKLYIKDFSLGGFEAKVGDVYNSPRPLSQSIQFISEEGDIAEIKSGAVFWAATRIEYDYCNENKQPFENDACMANLKAGAIQEQVFNIKPRAIRENGQVVPFMADIYPLPSSGIQKVNVEPFDINDDLSRVRLVNNAGTAIEFTGKDITITPTTRDWAELGVSFKARVYPLSLPSQCDPGAFVGEECAIPKPIEVYDTIECKLPERKCYLNGVEVTGFIGGRVQRTHFCREDSQCYQNQKCMEGLCVMKATCSDLSLSAGASGVPVTTTGPNKADVIFACDGYPTERACIDDIKKAIDKEGANNGIFSVEPFKSNIQKFRFYTSFGSAAPTPTEGLNTANIRRYATDPSYGLIYTIRYWNSFRKQCPSSDYSLLLSKINFRSFALPEGLSSTIVEAMGGPADSSAYVSSSEDIFPEVALHESGHLFGDLRDEYYEPSHGMTLNTGKGEPNCLPQDEALEKWAPWPKVIADAREMLWTGCGGPACDLSCGSLLKPSENSIMNDKHTWLAKRDEPGWKAFNEPSEAQLIEKLNAYS